MKNLLLATAAFIGVIVLGFMGLISNQPGLLLAVMCSYTPVAWWFGIAVYKFLFNGSRRLGWIQDSEPVPATTNGLLRRQRRRDAEPAL